MTGRLPLLAFLPRRRPSRDAAGSGGRLLPLALVTAGSAVAGEAPAPAPVPALVATFDEGAAVGWRLVGEGDAARRHLAATVGEGRLVLLGPFEASAARATLPAKVGASQAADLELRFTFALEKGAEGFGVVFGPAPEAIPERPEAPSLPGAIGVGFDAKDPVNRDPFRGSGNLYDRPQHLLSLHALGAEVVKRRTRLDFRDGAEHRVLVRLRFVPGAALATVRIDAETVFADEPLLAARPVEPNLTFLARHHDTAGAIELDDVALTVRPLAEPPAGPVSVVLFDAVPNDAAHPRAETVRDLPDDPARFERIVCTLTLAEPEGGFDPWDRIARLFVEDERAGRVEVLRWITPYGRGFTWRADVTDLAPVLRGRRRFLQECVTYGPGWILTLRLDYYPGHPRREPARVVPLWRGNPVIGDPDRPVEAFYAPIEVALEEGEAAARVRLTVTGHGMSPNTGNAAEFLQLGRTLTIDARRFESRLWKDDNDLNPCRPQGGTWKYDRAGWAPGDVVRPWIVDVPDELLRDGRLVLDYDLEPYVNEARGRTWAPTHLTEAVLVTYRRR